MKVSKQYVGKEVKVTWRDPGHDRIKSHLPNHEDVPSGWDALSTWVERGLLDDCRDGVLRILHSEGYERGELKPDEFLITWVPEALIVKIEVLAPVSVDTGGIGTEAK